ncbi:glycosyltransferase family 39 protein [Nonomuraea sp. B19D2]|uniref:ArnT family glycosyltransferase n=1 Tax=Nonomuraea sp. B19D2 TaxID=3159561 RepID=UPI0032DA7E95
MSSATQSPPLTAPPTPRISAHGATRKHVWALLGICALAAVLYGWALDSGNYANAYYSAAVKSMTGSFTNFLFAAGDPAGVVTAAKPPLAFWPQVLMVWLFGFHSWSIMLPQVIEGVAAVFLVHRTVRLWAGENVALLASLILALTPVTVAINRSNNTDTLLVLLLVAAAYAGTRAVHTGNGRWLYLSAFYVGCGFMTKLMAAWVVVPAIAVVYLVCGTATVKRRVADLLGAGAVLAVTSFWWPVLFDLWSGRKPFMGATMNGGALENIFGYNGFGKIFNFGQQYGGSGLNVQLAAVGMSGGEPTITRMFALEAGGQISWLLPLSLLVLAVVGAAGYRRLWHAIPGDRLRRAGWLLWGTWLLVTIAVFSFTEGIFHPYYTTSLAPAISAISAAGLMGLWREYRDGAGRAWVLLPAAVAVTAAWAVVLISRDASWHGWTRWVVLVTAALAVLGLVAGRQAAGGHATVGRWALLAGVVSMLLTPAVWSAGTAIEHKTNGGFPSAGPPNEALNALTRGELPPGVRIPGMEDVQSRPPRGGGFAGTTLSAENRKLLDYAVRNSGNAEIALAIEGGGLAASSFIIDSDAVVVSMGGYLGADNAPSVGRLRQWVAQGKLRFVLSAAPGGPRMGGIAGMGGERQKERVAWVEGNCSVVDPATYGGTPPQERLLPLPSFGDATLYRCG